MKRQLVLSAAALVLLGCSQEAPVPTTPEPSADRAAQANAVERLDAVLAAQPEETQARYAQRRPKETLQFFGVEPGMTVVDTLPGEVWYSGLLMNYLGPNGRVIAADYSQEMWTQFGDYSPDPAEKAKWTTDFVGKMEAKRGEDDAEVVAVHYGAIPDEMAGTADVVLVVRAIQHFMRLEGELDQALADMNKVLKPGGIVGVVAHRAPEQNSDEWANGSNGYVKQSAVIAAFEQAGFELVEASEINANPKDQPTEKDFVWRLAPNFVTSQDNPELRSQMEAIGESDRMTLKFRKPA